MEIKIYTSFNNFEKNYKNDYDKFIKLYKDYTYELYLEDLLDKYLEYHQTNYLIDEIIPTYDLSSHKEQAPKLINLSDSISSLEEYIEENEIIDLKNIIKNHTNIIINSINQSLDFSEYSFLLKFLKLEKDYYDSYNMINKKVHLIFDYNSMSKLLYSFDKIIRHIEDEINNLKSENEYLDNIPIETKGRIIDKVIYLNELGIIDFFKTKPPYNTSINKIAEVISLLIDEKRASIQPYINDLINKNEHSKNYPYNSQNKVNNIKKDLIERGLQ